MNHFVAVVMVGGVILLGRIMRYTSRHQYGGRHDEDSYGRFEEV